MIEIDLKLRVLDQTIIVAVESSKSDQFAFSPQINNATVFEPLPKHATYNSNKVLVINKKDIQWAILPPFEIEIPQQS